MRKTVEMAGDYEGNLFGLSRLSNITTQQKNAVSRLPFIPSIMLLGAESMEYNSIHFENDMVPKRRRLPSIQSGHVRKDYQKKPPNANVVAAILPYETRTS